MAKSLLCGAFYYFKGAATETFILEAINTFRNKYHQTPEAVYMNPADLGKFYNVGGLPVRPDKTVVANNLYVTASTGVFSDKA